MLKIRHILPALLALVLPQTVIAKQGGPSVHLEITARTPAYGGRSFGAHGSYERITGKAHMRIDPLAPANRGIVDLALAPRASDGMVEYETDFVIERPVDPAKARRVLFYDVVNRGMRLLSMMTGGGAMRPDDPGDGLLQRQGYTLVASGWQGDVSGGNLIGARFPVATDRGKPISGPAAAETIFDSLSGMRIPLSYPAASRDLAKAQLTVRAVSGSPARVVPDTEWRYVDERAVLVNRPADMDAGAIYRFEYIARDPKVMGLGFAATRDLIAYLRHAPAQVGNPLGDIGRYDAAVAFGGSQSGRYLRDFLWQGFNRDLAGRRVFDGVIPFIPGARRTFTNFRFAEPGRFSRQHEDHDVPGFTYPYAYATLTDPVTGETDGILKRCTATRTCPKLFHIDTSAEFWQAGSALVGTGGTNRDVALPDYVRAYMITGGAHAPGMIIPACRYSANSLNYTPIVRAMLIAMVDWTTKGTVPPASRWPLLARGELKTVAALKGPAVPTAGLEWPKVMNRPIPPAGRGDWPAYVPAIDADGNDAPGIRLPAIAAPEGTYLGWNLRKAGYGEGDLCLLAGAYVPFASDAASRGGDTRKSLAERYPLPATRQALQLAQIAELKGQRLLLAEDAAKLAADAVR